MKIITETSLSDFEFWGGAVDVAKRLTKSEFDIVETYLEQNYSEGLTDTEINDFFWFDTETVIELTGDIEPEFWER